MNDEDLAVIEKIKNGDSNAFNMLVLKYQKQVFNFINRMINNFDDALDLTQDTFFKAYKNINSFKFNSKFSTWLYKISYNHSINFIKRNNKKNELLNKLDVKEFSSDKCHVEKNINDLIDVVLNKINSGYRSAIYLFYKENSSYEDISKIMGIPLNTVRSHIRRGKKCIKELLTADYKIDFFQN